MSVTRSTVRNQRKPDTGQSKEKRTGRIKVEHSHIPKSIRRHECHLPIMDQEIGRDGVHLLQVFTYRREFVREFLGCRQISSASTWPVSDGSLKSKNGTHLERDKPHALDQIPNQYKVLENPNASSVKVQIEERQTHQSLIPVKTLCIDFRSVGVDEVSVDVADGRYGITSRVFGS